MLTTLAKRAASSVPSEIRGRGRDYFADGCVELRSGDSRSLVASVQGTYEYEVTLEHEGRALFAECNCPYYDDRGVCKHIWATVLAADASPYLSVLKDGSGAIRIIAADQDDEDDEDDEDDDLALPASSHAWALVSTRAPSPAARAPRPAAWTTMLQLARPSLPAQPTGRPIEIGYTIDVARSRLAAGRLIVEVVRRNAQQKKGAAGWTRQPITDELITACASAEDREILSALCGANDAQTVAHAYYYGRRATAEHALSAPMCDLLLPRMCATGRCMVRRTRDAEPVSLRWDGGEPWQLRVRAVPTPGKAPMDADWDLVASLRRGDDEVPLDAIDLLLERTVFFRDTAARLADDAGVAWIQQFLQLQRVQVNASERRAFIATIYEIPGAPTVEFPEGWKVPEVAVAPAPCLQVRAPKEGAGGKAPVLAELWLDYDRLPIHATRPATRCFDEARWRVIRRDHAAEQAARERLAALGFEPIAPRHARVAPAETELQIAPPAFPAAVRALLAEGWKVEASGKLFREARSFRMSVSSGIDWFDLTAAVDFEGISADLAALLEALRRGESTVTLGDGSIGVLPEEWLARYGLFTEIASLANGKLRFRKSQLGMLDVLLSAQPEVVVDEVFARARAELRRADSLAPADPPESFRGELRPYQRDGLGWLHYLDRLGFGGCLADDMGLGKTVQVLALLAARNAARAPARRGKKASAPGKPSLVVAPRSLIFNWKNEAARFTPDLRVLDHTGADRLPPGAHFADHDVVLTTYGTLRRDIEALAGVDFDYAILDEAQAIKNETSDTAKAARLLRAGHRLALSGTPIENHLGELWSLFEFLNPGILGRSAALAGAGSRDRNLAPETITLLARALRPFILRRTKAAIARDLPDRTEETWMVEMKGKQRRLYDDLRKHYRASLQRRVAKDGMARAKIQILEALLRLRQAACHPALVDRDLRGSPSAKLEALFAELPQLRESGQKALVFSQFTSLLSLVRERLDHEKIPYEYLDGRTRDRQARVDRFQSDPGCPFFLVSLKAGGLGLNLTAAEYVFLLDPWWNPAVEAQAIDRAHRIGQTKPVFAYRLIARDTIEERIAELQRSKRKLAESVIEGDGGLLREMTVEDLDLLLS